MNKRQLAHALKNDPVYALQTAISNNIEHVDDKLYNDYNIPGTGKNVGDIIGRMAMAVKGKSISETNKIVADLLDIPILYENLDSATYDAIIGNSYSRTGGTVRTNTFYSDLDQMNHRNDYLDSGIGEGSLAGGGQSAEEIIANSAGDSGGSGGSGANWGEILTTGIGIVDGIIGLLDGLNGNNSNPNPNTGPTATPDPDEDSAPILMYVLIGVFALILGFLVYKRATD